MESQVVGILLSSTVVAGAIAAITNICLWFAGKKERDNDKKDTLEDRVAKMEVCTKNVAENVEEMHNKLDTALAEQSKLLASIRHSEQLLMRDRIKSLAQEKLRQESISYEDRKLLHDMWDAYHNDWGGNGDLNLIMEAIDELTLEV